MTISLSWTSPVSLVPFVGPTYSKKLEKLNIYTLGDLLTHIPFRYEKYICSPINSILPGQKVSVSGNIQSFISVYSKKGARIQKMIFSDSTGILNIIWFNQPFLTKTLKPGMKIAVAGISEYQGKNLVMLSPEYEILNNAVEKIHTRNIVPQYHETGGISSKWLRSKIAWVLNHATVSEWLPEKIIRYFDLIPLTQALRNIHFPDEEIQIETARKRLAFDELFTLTLRSQLRRQKWKNMYASKPIKSTGADILAFASHLPFSLTDAQQKAIDEISADLNRNTPMNRLLVGDVGSGKTVVAAFSAYLVHVNGYKSAIMVPTEILALQHYETFKQYFSSFKTKIGLRTQNKKTADEDWDILIGTQALIQKTAVFHQTKLVIIDEQHKFGVSQRGLLRQKGELPHVLTMTATPIPRTSALVTHGELDVSYIDQMPQGNRSIKTWVVPPQKRASAYEWIKKEITQTKAQVFIVCPFVDPSETNASVKAATTEFEKLKNTVFPQMRVDMVHGKLPSSRKEAVLTKFRQGKIDILVATPVIEVGIDIPGASIMLIEAAQRFGLAQLHQFRGRIGRLGQQSYCLLFSESESAQKRLFYLSQLNDGSKLAEVDFEIRGPGDMYGTIQHGRQLFKIATFSDTQLFQPMKQFAQEIINNETDFPQLLKERLDWDTIDTITPD